MTAVGNFLPGQHRKCDTTGLPVCLTAELFIKLHAVMAVVFLLVGAVGAILLALTRWPTIQLLDPTWYYRILTLHGLNMLIFWILNFEVAVLYFAGSVLLNSRLFSAGLAWTGFLMMLVGAVMVNAATPSASVTASMSAPPGCEIVTAAPTTAAPLGVRTRTRPATS